jgi:ceramide glucosyltransferase
MAGHAVLKLDLSVELMRRPIPQFIGKYSFNDFWQRHLRWGRIRKSIAPFAFLIEPIFFSTLSGVCGAVVLSQLLSVPYLLGWALHMGTWAIVDLFLSSLMDKPNWKAFVFWVLREILAFPLWFCILCGNTVNWRGSRYRLLAGGLLEGRT